MARSVSSTYLWPDFIFVCLVEWNNSASLPDWIRADGTISESIWKSKLQEYMRQTLISTISNILFSVCFFFLFFSSRTVQVLLRNVAVTFNIIFNCFSDHFWSKSRRLALTRTGQPACIIILKEIEITVISILNQSTWVLESKQPTVLWKIIYYSQFPFLFFSCIFVTLACFRSSKQFCIFRQT